MDDFGFYFSYGWDHIMDWGALDHLLFVAVLACIYLPRDWKQVLILITAFTLGHTITLVLSTLQVVSPDIEWIEFLIPCTIAFTAISNLFVRNFTPRAIRVNYALALFFGLIHGLAFAEQLRFALASEQSFALAMVAFSLGLELGQILVVIGILLLAQLLVGNLRLPRRFWVIGISVVVLVFAIKVAIERFPAGEAERGSAGISNNRFLKQHTT